MSLGAAHFDGDRCTAVGVRQRYPTAVGTHPPVAPLHQSQQRGQQLLPLVRQVIVLPAALACNVIRAPLQEPILHELLEPGGRDLLAELCATRELIGKYVSDLRLLNVLME
jgi:hypothetical protein